MFKLNNLSTATLKETFQNIDGLTAFAICSFVEGEDTYQKVTSFLSKRTKIRFDINYDILKYKKPTPSQIEEAYSKIKEGSQDYIHLADDEDINYDTKEIVEEQEELSAIERYMSLYMCEDVLRYEKLNVYLDGAFNDKSFENTSYLELLLKTKSLQKEAFEYDDTNDYLEFQLPQIQEQENNTLFKNIFEFTKSSLKNSSQITEENYDALFIDYENCIVELYTKRFKVFEEFINNLYSKDYIAKEVSTRTIYKDFEEYSDDEFQEVFEFYLYYIKKDGLLKADDYLYEEKNPFIKTILDDYVMICTSKEVLQPFWELENKALINEMKKKILIVKLGLKYYISRITQTQLSKSKFYYETQLKLLFDKEIRDELFEYIT